MSKTDYRSKPIQEAANDYYKMVFDDELRELIKKARRGDDDAMTEISEMPLACDKIVTDHRREIVEWELLLGTGGPASRVLVTTDQAGIIEDVDFQYQDWFTEWTSAEGQDKELVEEFANMAGFYEDLR